MTTFKQRRQALLNKLPPESAVILFAAHEMRRNNDVFYPFRQESYFWYFTGFPEAEAIAVITREKFTLFSLIRDPLREIWDGKIIGQEKAISDFGADESFDLSKIDLIPELIANAKHIYGIFGDNPTDDARLTEILRKIHQLRGRGGAEISGISDLRLIAAEMRLVKSSEEIQQIIRSAEISAHGHRAGILVAKNAHFEYEIQAAVEHAFMKHGCGWSFPSIIASGSNACCLHYRENNAPINHNALMLIDAGAEYNHYAGDLSRTFPASGKFTTPQAALYNIVLAAQSAGIENARVGMRHLELHEIVTRVLIQGLLDEKVISGTIDDWLENNRYKQFYPHGTGHWLGLDVHDVGIYMLDGESRCYQENMVVTVEPGLYIQTYDTEIAEKWRGIGIRIEDDVLVGKDCGLVLGSQDLPKNIHDIELFMKEG